MNYFGGALFDFAVLYRDGIHNSHPPNTACMEL